MKPITNPSAVTLYLKLIDEMMIASGSYERDFDPAWLRLRKWKVVPSASEYGHFGPEEISRVVPVLNNAGYSQCLAVATEPLDPLPLCYDVVVSAEDFRNFRQECGLLRYLLMDEARSWAISCYGGYKLFAGPTELLERLLGQSIPAAQKNFRAFIHSIDPGITDSLLLRMASRYENA
jgi:hypothetical protein